MQDTGLRAKHPLIEFVGCSAWLLTLLVCSSAGCGDRHAIPSAGDAARPGAVDFFEPDVPWTPPDAQDGSDQSMLPDGAASDFDGSGPPLADGAAVDSGRADGQTVPETTASDLALDTTDAGPTEEVTPPPPPPYKAIVDRDALPALLALIGQARQQLDMVHLEWKSSTSVNLVKAAVAAAARRGVAVRVLLDNDVEDNDGIVALLQQLGAQARLDTTSDTLHAKMAVADGRTALVGSTNLSWAAFDSNHEANLLLNDDICAPYLASWAQALWQDDTENPPSPGTRPAGALCWPYGRGGAADLTIRAIDQAEQRIWVIMYAFNVSIDYEDGPTYLILEALHDAADRGVDVRVVLEDGRDYAPVGDGNREAAGYLQQRGVAVRYDGAAQITHDKLVLADDEMVVGSANWSYSGMELNHEVGAWLHEPAVAADFAAYFLNVWQASEAP